MGVSNPRDDRAERSLGSAQHGHPSGWKRSSTTESYIEIFFLAQHHRKIEEHLCSLPG